MNTDYKNLFSGWHPLAQQGDGGLAILSTPLNNVQKGATRWIVFAETPEGVLKTMPWVKPMDRGCVIRSTLSGLNGLYLDGLLSTGCVSLHPRLLLLKPCGLDGDPVS